MTISAEYIGTGKSLMYNGSTAYTIYGRDFNPRQTDIPDPPSGRDENTIRASGETSFNLSGFQCGNEVCFCSYTLRFVDLANKTYTVNMMFQKYTGGWQNAGWTDTYSGSFDSNNYIHRQWFYVGVDDDEIRPGSTQYRFLIQVSCNGEYEEFIAPFTISNLSFDTTLHNSGYMWVDGVSLNFIDGVHLSKGYRHIINQDTSYSATYVGTGEGSIWLPSSSTDNHIYYIDENGYKRRTAASQTRYDENNQSAGSGKAGYMWVSSSSDGAYGYGHLCYVNNVGIKRRITNGGVS